MAFIRKALFVATGGLLGLVFKEEAKNERTAKVAAKQVRPRKQTQRAAGRQTKRATRRPAPRTARASTIAKTARSGDGAINELERLADLHGRRALTDEEFAAAKAKILGTNATPPASGAGTATFPAVEANIAAARHLGDLAVNDAAGSLTTVSSD
jgi:hypothetical protein